MNTLDHPRTPKFKGKEVTSWSSIDKSFNGFIDAAYKNGILNKKDTKPTDFKSCSDKLKQWISEHSILGNPEVDTFDIGVVLPVVNPITGKLNSGGVRSAMVYADRVSNISDTTKKETKELLTKLYKDNFNSKDTAVENLSDIITALHEVESKKEILHLLRKCPEFAIMSDGLSDNECIELLENMVYNYNISLEDINNR